MAPWLERRWVGSESEKEGGGLSTDAYCPLRLAAVSRGATAGEGKKEGVKCKRKIRICLAETKGKRSHPPGRALTKLRANSAWYVEWKQMSVLWHGGSFISHLQLIHLCLWSLLFTNQCYIRKWQKLTSRGGQFAYCSGRNSGIKVCSPFQPDINQVTYWSKCSHVHIINP